MDSQQQEQQQQHHTNAQSKPQHHLEGHDSASRTAAASAPASEPLNPTKVSPNPLTPSQTATSPHTRKPRGEATAAARAITQARSTSQTQSSSTQTKAESTTPAAQTPNAMEEPTEEEYVQFVQSLGFDESILQIDDDEEYQLDEHEHDADDDDEDDDDDAGNLAFDAHGNSNAEHATHQHPQPPQHQHTLPISPTATGPVTTMHPRPQHHSAVNATTTTTNNNTSIVHSTASSANGSVNVIVNATSSTTKSTITAQANQVASTPSHAAIPTPATPQSVSSARSSTAANESFWHDLEEELGSLLEEDLEAAVATLLNKQQHTPSRQPSRAASRNLTQQHHQATKGASSQLGTAATTASGMLPVGQAGAGMPHNPFRTAIPGTSSSMEQMVEAQRHLSVGVPAGSVIADPHASIGGSATTAANQLATKAAALRPNLGTIAAPAPFPPHSRPPNMPPHTITAAGNNRTMSIPSTASTPRKATNLPPTMVASPLTPLREAKRQAGRHKVTQTQAQSLQRMMRLHYQLLVQQSVLAVRSAHAASCKKPDTPLKLNQAGPGSVDGIYGAESADELAEIIDGAVGMLQDLEQHRKDAIRYAIQLEDDQDDDSNGDQHNYPHSTRTCFGPFAEHGTEERMPSDCQPRRSLLSQFQASDANNGGNHDVSRSSNRRLTRAAFVKTLREHSQPADGNQSHAGNRVALAGQRTVFNIPGLANLADTLRTLDASVDKSALSTVRRKLQQPSVLHGAPGAACNFLLRKAGATIESSFLPLQKPLSVHFSDIREFLGPNHVVGKPLTRPEEMFLVRNKNLFTSAEDNLVLRGVNLYGEKQWTLIMDRFLPDRTIHGISQRYSKLCLLLYRARGVWIDPNGKLEPTPKLESVDDIDENAMKRAGLVRVPPPAILNVHRWSLEEDLTLLKAIPIMGNMWAELGARLIPHRDRGHLRKRHQVLVRRISRAAKFVDMISSARIVKNTKAPAAVPARRGAAAKHRVANAVKLSAPIQRPTMHMVPLAQPVTTKAKMVSVVARPVTAAPKAKRMKVERTSKPALAAPVVTAHLATPVRNAPLGFDAPAEGSRMEIEKMLADDGAELSQLSCMKKLLDDDNDIHLSSKNIIAGGPPPMALDLGQSANSNLSFNFSNLQASAGLSNLPPIDGLSVSKYGSEGILANVLERANSNSRSAFAGNSGNNDQTTHGGAVTAARKRSRLEVEATLDDDDMGLLGRLQTPTSPAFPNKIGGRSGFRHFDSPQRRQTNSFALPSATTLATPSTPSENLFSANAFSSPKRTQSPSKTARGDSTGFALTPTADYSPASLRLYSPNGNSILREGLNGILDMSNYSKASIMGVETHQQQQSSINAGDLGMGNKVSATSATTDRPVGLQLSPSKNSLLYGTTNSLLSTELLGTASMGAHDLEAIAALNTLSNSANPVHFARQEGEAASQQQAPATSTQPRSLFATVMGGTTTKDKRPGGKRKLEFD